MPVSFIFFIFFIENINLFFVLHLFQYVNLFFRSAKITFLWWFCRGCSPLPIPNREVKPLMADGTAQQCGRVGSCHIYLKSLSGNWKAFLLGLIEAACELTSVFFQWFKKVILNRVIIVHPEYLIT